MAEITLNANLERKPDLYFWRSHGGLEVDLLIVINGELQPVEILLTAKPAVGHVDAINRFNAFAGEETSSQGILLCRTGKQGSFTNGHIAMPWQAFPEWL